MAVVSRTRPMVSQEGLPGCLSCKDAQYPWLLLSPRPPGVGRAEGSSVLWLCPRQLPWLQG